MGYLIEIDPLSGHISWAKPVETTPEQENLASTAPADAPPPPHQCQIELNLGEDKPQASGAQPIHESHQLE